MTDTNANTDHETARGLAREMTRAIARQHIPWVRMSNTNNQYSPVPHWVKRAERDHLRSAAWVARLLDTGAAR